MISSLTGGYLSKNATKSSKKAKGRMSKDIIKNIQRKLKLIQFLGLTSEMKKSLEIQSAIIAVKKQTLMVTTKIIQNLLKLCGYASDATLNYIGGK